MKLWDFILLKLKKEFEDHIADGHPFGSDLPVGAIIMWFSNDIPDGWVLCDGFNSTPDLRNKHVVGSPDEFELGFTGTFGNAGTYVNIIMVNWIMKT